MEQNDNCKFTRTEKNACQWSKEKLKELFVDFKFDTAVGKFVESLVETHSVAANSDIIIFGSIYLKAD